MSKKNVEKLVDEFLVRESRKRQNRTFSQVWRDDLVKRALTEESKKRKFNIKFIHEEKISEMLEVCRKWLRNKYKQASQGDIDDSVTDAYFKWDAGFDAKKAKKATNPERNFLLFLADRELITRFNKDNPIIDEERTTTVWLETEVKSEDRLQEKFERDESKGTINIGRTRYAAIAAKEIFRIFLLTESFEPTSRKRIKPAKRTTFEHDKKALVDIYQKHIKDPIQFELLKDSSSTDYNIKRWEILRSADTRRWMELAISELRKSAKQKETHLLELGLDERVGGLELAISCAKKSKEDIAFLKKIKNGNEIIELIKTPVLSSVALDEKGNLIETCFKGQMEEDTMMGTWAKHCEFSLFTEKIGENKMDLLKDGTLYTTLEPCNRRGTYLEGDKEKPKIPCAVRCLESGIRNICIALDYNKRVFEKGLSILKTGEYTFDLEKSEHKGEIKERRAAELLEKYLKKYPLITSTETERIYKINEGLNVSFFHVDLLQEVKELNALFLLFHQDGHEKEFFDLL